MITFATLIISFFSSYLANQKGYSPETIASYSDCIKLLINYTCKRLDLTIDKLAIDMISDQIILDFLDYLEKETQEHAQNQKSTTRCNQDFFPICCQPGADSDRRL